ncbi:uncharacterized protein LOC111332508 [Stylophora pistillata]|uniref:Apple domain-containing protein n=1 Tax=Stylophora pistillata TaxID=50429 RepID=A0A2B4S5H2_STYPI|nr:uncharacterized protein LOC111332508 [Stylophora pistillata]PFX23808.1 hypothetical protein AWC38_SpisGene11632 [Stylophora pistillata]
MRHDKNHSSKDGFLLVAFVSTIFITCVDHGVTGDCDGPDEANMEPQHCTGYEIATHPVSTIVQCLDECLRLPHCDKLIFTGNGSESCKLLSTDGISTAFDARNLPQITGACAPTDMNIVRQFLLGTEDCPQPTSKKSNYPDDR